MKKITRLAITFSLIIACALQQSFAMTSKPLEKKGVDKPLEKKEEDKPPVEIGGEDGLGNPNLICIDLGPPPSIVRCPSSSN